ncbi:CHAD domain-containing protein [Pseudomonas sp. LPB0260]|uniref:CHAD domain-containing protein n=1 Tax=Pseudomonas sp. LPB0260 TaxID=2614442 RepID=UPI0015C20D7C|nr:CHAD domain-containing protein [Pseudomonas sp. LPB0260]QLC72266.1 CHAD domain-containing protein [Pseudomonas sp. LPB0260]QLC75043.1 CHAD domain-containing protein [Pseudomonas sp. LPB0260]
MAAVVDKVLEQVLTQQVRLYACRERLVAATDPEALHDLRIALRRLRSLLRPLRGLSAIDRLQASAVALARLSGPLRDLEVLLGHLRDLEKADALARRLPQLRRGYVALLESRELQALFDALDDWPQQWHRAQADKQLKGVERQVRRRLTKQRRLLGATLADVRHDRHRLRLLIKQVRYAAEAYPGLGGVSAEARAHLKQAQAALGDWHDRLQWLLRAEQEPDLAPCVAIWRAELDRAERSADQALLQLQADFPAPA